MSRNVVLVSPKSNAPIRINDFSGSTWGELKNHASVYSHVADSNVEAILRQGNVTLNREDAALPEGDVTVFLVPTKNKAGMSPEQAQAVGQQISEAIVIAAAISSENDINQLKEDLISEIASFFDVDEYDIVSGSESNTASSPLSEEDQALMSEYGNYRG